MKGEGLMKIIYIENKFKNDERIYLFKDGSFGPMKALGYFQLSLDDSSSCLLNVDRITGSILSVEGYFPFEEVNSIKRFNFNPSYFINGEIKLIGAREELNDEGCFMPLKDQSRYYDEEKNIYAIGFIEGCECIKFGENLYAFFKQKSFCGIAIKLIKE